MHELWSNMKAGINRRSFVKSGLAAGVATVGAGMLANSTALLASDAAEDHGQGLSRGDAALLPFAGAEEILQTHCRVHDSEKKRLPDRDAPGGSGTPAFAVIRSELE